MVAKLFLNYYVDDGKKSKPQNLKIVQFMIITEPPERRERLWYKKYWQSSISEIIDEAEMVCIE